MLNKRFFVGKKMKRYSINKLSSFLINEVKFSEYESPHAGLYCLLKKQLENWTNSGDKWRDKVVAFGTLESAATFCLCENSKIFKPSTGDLNFLKVKHWGTKYSVRFFKEFKKEKSVK